MKYLIDLSQRQAQLIQRYLDLGHYKSVNQFIITSIENQFSLEENPELIEDLKVSDSPKPEIHAVYNPLKIHRVLEAYRIADMDNVYSVFPAPVFNETVLSINNIPEKDVWLWGQINKMFPVKVGLRILQKNIGNKQSIELNEFLENAAREASEIGNIIREYEKNNSKERNEKISAGLPQPSDEKSQSRYKYQFLAYLRKDGLLDGAMAILKFCNIERKNNKVYIGLTDAGQRFSSQSNPVLDKGDLNKAFSENEIEFYLNHIEYNLIGEALAIKWLLNKIHIGVNERSELTKELKNDYNNIWQTTETVINTQRAGLTARVYELGLIEKEKNGIRVIYKLSKAGLKLIHNQ